MVLRDLALSVGACFLLAGCLLAIFTTAAALILSCRLQRLYYAVARCVIERLRRERRCVRGLPSSTGDVELEIKSNTPSTTMVDSPGLDADGLDLTIFPHSVQHTACQDVLKKLCRLMCFATMLLKVIFLAGAWWFVRREWHDATGGNLTPPEVPGPARCYESCSGTNFSRAWANYSRAHVWKMVRFPSRAGPRSEPAVNVSAWWLPGEVAGGAGPARQLLPRIVVSHGWMSNNNGCSVQAACYLLRTMGFGCLAPSMRDYARTGKSAHPRHLSWGYDVYLDILGAWDYAVRDPDGILGGPLPPDQVGLFGFSKGGFESAIAFALEERIPAAWLDSPPFTGMLGVLDDRFRPYLGPLTPLARQAMYSACQYLTGGAVQHDLRRPLERLVRCNQSGPLRHIALVHDLEDRMVKPAETVQAIKLLSSLPRCYDVSTYWFPSTCDGSSHHTYMFQFPDDARIQLCRFWSRGFKRSTDHCRLDKLPKFQRADIQTFLPAPSDHT